MSNLQIALLKALKKYPCRWKKLIAVWIAEGGSGNLKDFRKTIHVLLDAGYVTKNPDDRLSPYVITKAGEARLEVLLKG